MHKVNTEGCSKIPREGRLLQRERFSLRKTYRFGIRVLKRIGKKSRASIADNYGGGHKFLKWNFP